MDKTITVYSVELSAFDDNLSKEALKVARNALNRRNTVRGWRFITWSNEVSCGISVTVLHLQSDFTQAELDRRLEDAEQWIYGFYYAYVTACHRYVPSQQWLSFVTALNKDVGLGRVANPNVWED